MVWCLDAKLQTPLVKKKKRSKSQKKIYDADPGPWLSDTSANQLSFLLQPRGLSGFGINFRDPPPKLLEIAVNPRGLSDFGKKYPPPPQKLLKK